MNRTEHLLSIVAEECAEVAQRVTKAMRFGLKEIQPGQDQTNAERIIGEMYDLVAVVDLLMQEGALPSMTLTNSPEVMAKQAKVEHYLKFSAQCGTFAPDRRES